MRPRPFVGTFLGSPLAHWSMFSPQPPRDPLLVSGSPASPQYSPSFPSPLGFLLLHFQLFLLSPLSPPPLIPSWVTLLFTHSLHFPFPPPLSSSCFLSLDSILPNHCPMWDNLSALCVGVQCQMHPVGALGVGGLVLCIPTSPPLLLFVQEWYSGFAHTWSLKKA